jgi:hypothetical protein
VARAVRAARAARSRPAASRGGAGAGAQRRSSSRQRAAALLSSPRKAEQQPARPLRQREAQGRARVEGELRGRETLRPVVPASLAFPRPHQLSVDMSTSASRPLRCTRAVQQRPRSNHPARPPCCPRSPACARWPRACWPSAARGGHAGRTAWDRARWQQRWRRPRLRPTRRWSPTRVLCLPRELRPCASLLPRMLGGGFERGLA